jgi:AbiTii
MLTRSHRVGRRSSAAHVRSDSYDGNVADEMQDNGVLRSLRERVLDESEPLPGLLRKCLALGALTGSDALRAWATHELKGYEGDAAVPSYRCVPAPLFIDSTSGYTHIRGQTISKPQVPAELREYVPEDVDFRQSIDELARMADSKEKSLRLTRPWFTLVTEEWSRKLPFGQDIHSLYYTVSPSSLAGIVGMVRTTLVEMVVDMTRDLPLDALPSQARVDDVVRVHIGSRDHYQVNVESNAGVIGQGPNSAQIQNINTPTGLAEIVNRMHDALAEIPDAEERADAEQAIDDFQEAVAENTPQLEKIRRRSRALEKNRNGGG